MTLTIGQTVDIGGGRGRLAPDAAASVHRIDAQLGRPADINSAWRDPVAQQKLYDAWVAYSRYLAGGPWAPTAPRALPPSQSVHCAGEAADSDDWYDPHAAAVWRDNGWRQTARTGTATTDEPWHGEHFPALDNHRNETAGDGSTAFPATPGTAQEEDDMFTDQDRANLTSVMLALGASGLTPGMWKDEDTVVPVVRQNRETLKRVEKRVINIDQQVTGADGFDAKTGPSVAGRLIAVQKAIGAGGGLASLSDADLERIKVAVADELAKRLAS